MITKSQEETIEAGLRFAEKLKGGEILALTGELGSGKTTFIKGLAEGLQVNETITSPTFVLLKTYDARKIDNSNEHRIEHLALVHVDAYRAESIEDIKSVGIEDYLNRRDVILAIEWAEKIRKILPKNIIQIKFKNLNNNKREIVVAK